MINYSGTIQPRESTSFENLPVGIYSGIVKDATIETVSTKNGSFDWLIVKLDVADGEYKDHYTKQFEAQSGGNYPAKYKGVFRVTIPKAGDQYENAHKKQLEHLAWCLEESNAGYKYNGDESKMKGLKIGFTVRERDWMMERDGKITSGTTTEIGRVDSMKKVLAGELKPMKKKELSEDEKHRLLEYKKYAQNLEMADVSEEVTEELPF